MLILFTITLPILAIAIIIICSIVEFPKIGWDMYILFLGDVYGITIYIYHNFILIINNIQVFLMNSD